MTIEKIKIFGFVLLFYTSIVTYAQTPPDSLKGQMHTMAKFNGDDTGKNFREFMLETIHYPETANFDFIDGKVFAQFQIDSSGLIVDIQIIQSLREDFDNEVIKAIRLSPRWTPATNNNKPVSQSYTYVARFFNDKKSVKKFKRENIK